MRCLTIAAPLLSALPFGRFKNRSSSSHRLNMTASVFASACRTRDPRLSSNPAGPSHVDLHLGQCIMRVLIKCSILFTFASLVFAQVAATQASDEAAIREAVQKYLDARDQNSPAAVGALFTADADQLVSSGEWRKGR